MLLCWAALVLLQKTCSAVEIRLREGEDASTTVEQEIGTIGDVKLTQESLGARNFYSTVTNKRPAGTKDFKVVEDSMSVGHCFCIVSSSVVVVEV